MTITVTDVGDRLLLRVLAENVAFAKPRAQMQANELVPLVCDVPMALVLFDALADAVRRGDEQEARNLLDLLTDGAA